MSDDRPTDSSPWFLGMALISASALMMSAMGAITMLGLVWLLVGSPEPGATTADDGNPVVLDLTSERARD